ncbi:hypothetical protein N7478_005372 [Penicillium angulare]|uniref:uncharacterized protein n=1 Tax=Penicillium angulare TaxID=116970 RepID=UPI00253FC581|nr:uncharacterized protein N7478_005372 [Penicillium angulare]KAJ5280000.1 hypothetical protein N7478_005372 [Penicillium angulare]
MICPAWTLSVWDNSSLTQDLSHYQKYHGKSGSLWVALRQVLPVIFFFASSRKEAGVLNRRIIDGKQDDR